MTVTLLPPAIMPASGKRKVTAAEEIIRLREETKEKDEQLASLIRQLAAMKKKPKSKIPRPEGQAGRSSGYIVRDEMGLADDPDQYNRLFVSHCQRPYLLNMQTRRRKDLQLEGQADLRDRAAKPLKKRKHNSNETETETPNTPEPRSAKRPAKRRVNFRMESDEESCEDNLEPPRNQSKILLQDEGSEDEADVKPYKTTRPFIHFTDEDSDGSDEPSPKVNWPPKNVKPTPMPAYLLQKKSGRVHAAHLCRAKFSLDEIHWALFVSRKAEIPGGARITWHDLPLSCVKCAELLPVEPHPRILGLFIKREKLIGKTGSTAAGLPLIELQICEAITQEKDREQHADSGRRNGWLHEINFETLPERIEGLEDDILQIIKDPDFLEQSAAWRSFLKSIDGKLFHFCRSSSKGEFIYAVYGSRCGYYGPKGAQIINSKLVDALEGDHATNVLFTTLTEVVLMSEDSLDAYGATSNLLDIEDFIFFILAPFTAAFLISADKNVAFEDAVDICDNSCAFGDIFQPEEGFKSLKNQDSEVEEVVSGVEGTKENQDAEAIELTVWLNPEEKPKKTPKSKPPAKPKQKAETKPKQKADAHKPAPRAKATAIESSYGTRSKSRP
ncbi:hypothetical protein B0H16DRAFT_1481595 [Mycena metata]|uniref:Restriction of telomere capping protein 4 n=1 Tax=Mycena metata TaxID=1033252 RepID=A0AAD7GXF4_9AGAR|nr:hypothetical protein B0H16DRAFT_1481595 [Mycena metata]